MARTRQVERIENGRAFVNTEMKDGKNPDGTDRMVPLKYDVPATPSDFKAWVLSLPDAVMDSEGEFSGPLHEAHQSFWSGYDMKLRADLRESSVAESTVIKVDKRDVDLMDLPVKKAILAINGVFAVAAATDKEPQKAYVVARRKLLEAKQVTEVDMGGVKMLQAVNAA